MTGLEVMSSEICEFERKWRVPVLKIDNLYVSERNEVHQLAPHLNTICERLWMRDQDYLLKQGIVK